MKLILFDIDGTLIDSGGAGSRGLKRAFREAYSINCSFNTEQVAGRTDLEIIRNTLNNNGIVADDSAVASVADLYLRFLPDEMNNGDKHIKPGVTDLIEHISALKQFGIGLLTGNLEKGAKIKLDAFGLYRYFSFGAFGSDNEDRNRLLPIAVKRFRYIYGHSLDYSNCIVVGDTPRDVRCAIPYGARAIGVATGLYRMDELRKEGADLVLKDLCDHKTFLEYVSA